MKKLDILEIMKKKSKTTQSSQRRKKNDSAKKSEKKTDEFTPPGLEDMRFLSGDDSLQRETWRVFRIQSDLVKGLDKLYGISRGVSIFGSARIKRGSKYYELTRKVAYTIGKKGYSIITGGGPGAMEAANKGAQEAKALSIGLAIKLPFESDVNPFVDMKETFNFFFVRKVMLVKYAHAFVIMPGGFGTLDELFEALTLIQTGKVSNFPVILVGTEYWKPLFGFLKNTLLKEGMVKEKDFEDLHMTDDPNEVAKIIDRAWNKYIKDTKEELKQKQEQAGGNLHFAEF
jgi:uncharacterized protein (TIGR00730 family)